MVLLTLLTSHAPRKEGVPVLNQPMGLPSLQFYGN